MADRELVLQFVLSESDVISPSDFVGFFSLGEDVVRDLTVTEALEALEACEVPSAEQLEAVAQLQRLLRSSPAPAIVDEVRHSSPWLYILHIPAHLLGSFISKCLTPEIKRAWKNSAAQDRFYSFFRHKVFGGAKAKVQRSVVGARKRARGEVQAVSVEPLPTSTPTSPRLVISARRTETVQVQVSNEELAREFRKRLRE